MSYTSSISFPNLFDLTRNCVAVRYDSASVTNRTRLLILTEPTELYNNPTFGVGLKRYLWQYNTPNTKAIIQERIKSQLAEHEPCVEADKTVFVDGLVSNGFNQSKTEFNPNALEMTVELQTVYKDVLDVTLDLSEEQNKMFGKAE